MSTQSVTVSRILGPVAPFRARPWLAASGAALRTRAAQVAIFGVPLAFVVVSWLASAGFPYYFDNNETFLHYVSARNLETWNPNAYGWLTAEETDPQQPAPRYFYTHNPNGPRYLQYLLLKVGVREMAPQVLILGLLGTLLTSLMLWRAFGHPALVVGALAVVLDYGGFLAWTANTYRIWMFVLFFGLVVAVRRERPLWVGVLTFLVFQTDYGVAAFVAATTVTLAVLLHGWRSRWLVLASVAGAALSIALFLVQVFAFYGWDGFVNELTVTYVRRGTDGAGSGPLWYVFQAWHGPFLLIGGIAHDGYNLAVLLTFFAGLFFAVFRLRWGYESPEHRFLVMLTLSAFAGAVACSTVLYGYFVDAFIFSGLPLASFLVAPAVALVAFELRVIAARRWRCPHLGLACGALVLLPMVLASATHFRPPLAVDLFQRLQTEYRGRTFVAPNPGPALASAELAFALTGGRALRTTEVEATPEDVRRFERERDADGTLTYLCLDTLYIRQIEKPGAQNVCDEAAAAMVARGHEVIERGLGWTIVRLNREP